MGLLRDHRVWIPRHFGIKYLDFIRFIFRNTCELSYHIITIDFTRFNIILFDSIVSKDLFLV